MRTRLKNAISGEDATESSVLEVLQYFESRLSSKTFSERCAAAHGLGLLLEVLLNKIIRYQDVAGVYQKLLAKYNVIFKH